MSPRQAHVVDFIRRYQKANFGASPSCGEIAKEIGVKRHSQAWRTLLQLEDRHIISRETGVRYGQIVVHGERRVA